jgi:hypothetical protein
VSGAPFPKSAQLARGERRYRRKVASPKQWQAIIAAKGRVCRVGQALPAFPQACYGTIEYHHVLSRQDGGGDVADNIVPLCQRHHGLVTGRSLAECRVLVQELDDAEYAYLIDRGGEDAPERIYGVEYARG